MYAGGPSKRQFAPRFMSSAHGNVSNRSADGHIADVSGSLVIFSCTACSIRALSGLLSV